MLPCAKDQCVDARDLHLLVYSYLLHTNCARTASAFARTCGLATSGSLTSDTAPAYLSKPFKSERQSNSDTKPKEEEEEEEEEKTKKKNGKGCTEGIPPPPPTPPAPDCNSNDSSDARANELIAHHIEYLRIRQSICASIEAREPEVALDLLSTYFRSVLIPPPSSDTLAQMSALPSRQEFDATLLRFRLDIQCYVELIAKHLELDALQFGQRTLWRYTDIFDTWLNHSISLSSNNAGESLRLHYSSSSSESPPPPPSSAVPDPGNEVVSRLELKHKRAEIMRHITNVAALVAYTDPAQSPLAYLLTQERREELAAAVNAAILRSMSFPHEPTLVTLVRQLTTTNAYLVGYRSPRNSSSSSAATKKDDQSNAATTGAGGARHQPWLLDTFVNSDEPASTFA
ncbi:hypothetical protein GGI20_003491 [Coemansia sp. BCRC 34301]|nr:hypothetical protein GGI20_003491 [Coemansia sp. BCRC 34301]